MGTRYNDVWVTGATGYLGRAIARRLAEHGYTVYATAKDVNIAELDAVTQFMRRNRPKVVINAAGMRRDLVNVDTRLDAMRVNAIGARNVAIASAEINSLMVQLSSDDVFKRVLKRPVDEFDEPHPDSIYGKSKLVAEHFVRELNPRHIIIRSSWVYHAESGQLHDIIKGAIGAQSISAREDQIACPTSVDTLVAFTANAIREDEHGLFHVVSKGACSRREFACEVYRMLGADPTLVTAAPEDKDTAENVILDTMMIELAGLDPLPTWQKDIEAYLVKKGLAKGTGDKR